MYNTIEQAHEAGCVTLNYGRFLETVIYFLIVAFCMFLFVKLLMMFKKKEEDAAPSTDWP
ncbi:MAG: MscL family protein, partial [Gammaproteobacteria bacterium]|nr:MscL family protein [Gammaproteobacteria bacterium]